MAAKDVRPPSRNLDAARLLSHYRTMLRIRAFEEAALEGFEEKLVLGANGVVGATRLGAPRDRRSQDGRCLKVGILSSRNFASAKYPGPRATYAIPGSRLSG